MKKLFEKANTYFNDLTKQYGAQELIYRENKPAGSQDINTTCASDHPLDTIIVEDVSGSMGEKDYFPTRLDGGIEAGVEYTNTRAKRHFQDRIAVVSFSDYASIVLGLTDINKKAMIISAIESMTIEGGTNITTGLQKALEIFRIDKEPDHLRRVILLTDGHGGRPVSTAEKLKQKYNTLIDVIGIGGSPTAVNERLLRRVATTDPDGFNHYYFIKDSRTLREHYKQLATGLVWNGAKE